jgi:hypothetical protein
MAESKAYDVGTPGGQFHSHFEVFPDGLVMVKNTGLLNVECAHQVVAQLVRIREETGQRLLSCIDITEYEGGEPEARPIMREKMLGEDAPSRGVALFGGNFATRTLFNLYAKVASIPVRQFKNKEEAVAWLRTL